jgi:uncharacterized protein (UPF0147 family)
MTKPEAIQTDIISFLPYYSGSAILKRYIKEERYAEIKKIAEDKNAPKRMRKDARFALIELFCERGLLMPLEELITSPNVLTEVKESAKGKIKKVASKCIERYANGGYYEGLEEITKDRNLPEDLRNLAEEKIPEAMRNAIKRFGKKTKNRELPQSERSVKEKTLKTQERYKEYEMREK